MASPDEQTINAPPGVIGTPSGPVPYIAYPATQDYPRLVFSAPRFEVVAIADIIEPSVMEAVQGMLPTLVPPYVTAAANAAVQSLAVQLVGSTMTGPLMLSPAIPTANTMAATKQYVDTQIGTVIPEVPPVPAGQAWARELGQWVPIAGGGTVTNIATGAGLTGGPITATGTISMANMAANSLKGNNTGAVASPVDLNVGQVMNMLGAAPLNSPNFTGSPSLPTGTAAVTQPGGTANTTVATTAFVGAALGVYAPLNSPAFTGTPSLPTGTTGITQGPGTANNTLATTSFVSTALTPYALTSQLANYLPLTGGRLSGGLASGPAATTVPGLGALTLNANTVAPPALLAGFTAPAVYAVGANTANVQMTGDAFGTGGLQLIGRQARGTAAAGGQTATQSGDYLVTIGAVGYGTSYAPGFTSYFGVRANENWTASAQGSMVVFNTTPNGSTATVESLRLQGTTATFSGGANATSVGIGPASGDANLTLAAPGAHTWVVGSQVSPLGQFQLYDVTAPGQRLAITAAGACSASSTWSVISDASLKDQIEDHPHGLAEVVQLRPRRFRMAADDRIATGLIAQELEEIMPELVGEITDHEGNTVKTVTEAGVIWPMINALKEISARLTALEGRA